MGVVLKSLSNDCSPILQVWDGELGRPTQQHLAEGELLPTIPTLTKGEACSECRSVNYTFATVDSLTPHTAGGRRRYAVWFILPVGSLNVLDSGVTELALRAPGALTRGWELDAFMRWLQTPSPCWKKRQNRCVFPPQVRVWVCPTQPLHSRPRVGPRDSLWTWTILKTHFLPISPPCLGRKQLSDCGFSPCPKSTG